MKAFNDYRENYEYGKFPLYCRNQSCFRAYLLVDTETGAVWADTQDHNSCSERVWKGKDNRIEINGNFLDDDDLNDFIDDNLELVDKWLNDKITTEEFEDTIKVNACRWNDETTIVEGFVEYTEVCNLGWSDVIDELNTFDFNITEYAEDIASGVNGCVYFYRCTAEDLKQEIVNYLNDYNGYEAVFKDEGGWHKTLRFIVEENWDSLIEADEETVSDIFFKNDRSLDTANIFMKIQEVKNDQLDYEDFVEGLES